MQACVLQAVYALPNKQCIAGGKHTRYLWRCRWLQGGPRQSNGSRCSRPTARCRASRTSSLQRFKSGRRDTGTKLPTAVSCKLLPTGCSQSSLQLTWSPRYPVCQSPPPPLSFFFHSTVYPSIHARMFGHSFLHPAVHPSIQFFMVLLKGGHHTALSSPLYELKIHLKEHKPFMVAY